MSPTQNSAHRRTHNVLLISRLLALRENVSPFTLVLDSMGQSGKPLVREFIRRASAAKTKVIFISFETLRKPTRVDVFLQARSQSLSQLQKEISSSVSQTMKILLIFDSVNPIATPQYVSGLSQFLSSLISPTVSLLATYHTDIPALPANPNPYAPQPCILLRYLATTILTTHSLSHILAQKQAKDRSLEPPQWGLGKEGEGVIRGLGANDRRGVVVQMEYRRRSGRGVGEWFFLPLETEDTSTSGYAGVKPKDKERIILLEDHPLYRVSEQVPGGVEGQESGMCEEGSLTTFDLGLTEKQRKAREGVVLPYFDAQREGGEAVGEGGRILYEIGWEDDFDEEEDDI